MVFLQVSIKKSWEWVNEELPWKAIPLRFIATGELDRAVSGEQGEKYEYNKSGFEN